MKKNITLSAEENLILLAREKAAKESTTLNEQFRHWLERYVSTSASSANYQKLMDRLSYAHAGQAFSRDELNAR